MATKNFATAPRPPKIPTAEQIAAFERGGAGHDTPEGPTSTSEAAPPEPIKRLSLDLPQRIHTRFKTACSATNRKMVNEIQAFIEARTKELEEEAGISHK